MAEPAASLASVLIVDDHDKMRGLMRLLLPPGILTVHECSDGAAAVAAYEAHRPDCVLMDIELPLIDGIRATREILRRHPDARIIVVTHFDDPIHRRMALGAGAVSIVSKSRLSDITTLLAPPTHG